MELKGIVTRKQLEEHWKDLMTKQVIDVNVDLLDEEDCFEYITYAILKTI